MTGYLAAVAGRIGGNAFSVEPRPLARFEREVAGTDPAVERAERAAPRLSTPAPLAPMPPAPRQPARQAAPPAQPSTVNGAGQPAEAASRPASMPNTAQQPMTARSLAAVVAQPAPPTPAAPPPPPSVQGAVSTPSPRVPVLATQPIQPPASMAVAPPEPLPSPPPPIRASAEAFQSVPPAAEAPQDTGHLAMPPLPVPVRTRLADARNSTRPEQHAEPVRALPEAPIHVTIGRVDIRAAPRASEPPPAPRAEAPAPGAVSLDAYLRKRDGGGG